MKIIYSRYLPVKGFRAINLFGILFARKEQPLPNSEIINHELIRHATDAGAAGYRILPLYVVEWLIKWLVYRDRLVAYRNIGFEREAFENEANPIT